MLLDGIERKISRYTVLYLPLEEELALFVRS